MYHICEHHFQFSRLMNEYFNITVEALGSHNQDGSQNQDDMLENFSIF